MDKISGKKILYVWKDVYPWDIRIDKICTSLSNAGADVLILARNTANESDFSVFPDYKIKRFGKNTRNLKTLPVPMNIFWKNAILETAIEFKADLIIVREIMIARQAALVAKKLNIPVIMDMAENYPALMRLWKKYRNGVLNRLLFHKLGMAELTEKNCVPKMDGIVVVCDEQISRLSSVYHYPENKICVVHNTPPLNFYKKFTVEKRVDDRIIFCHHGHLTDEKKVDIFLKTLLSVPNHQLHFKFIIAGTGESLPELVKIHNDAGSPDNIVFTGKYNYDSLPKIISGCDYGVLPYLSNDFNNYTIHNKIFDYFAYGKPVIVSNVNPLKRIIAETGAGAVFDFSNSENAALLFSEIFEFKYKKMSENAQQAFKNKYNWQNDSNILIKFLEEYF